MPLFKNLDSVFGFVLLMLAAGTVVAAATQFAATLTRMRARFLRQAVEELLSQVAPAHLSSEDARQLALILLHHPWLCGRTNAGASSLRREDLVRLLVEVASQDSLLAARLRDALDLAGAGEALDLARRIGSHVLALELENPGECTRDRDTKAIIAAMGPHPLLACIHSWYGQAMGRATRRYMRQTRVITAFLTLALVLALRLDLFLFLYFHLPGCGRWPGMALSWLLISLGTPFWYDRMKDLLHFRPSQI